MPDIQTIGKLYRWLELDPASVLDVEPRRERSMGPNQASAHLRANRTIDPETSRTLANAIVKAQETLGAERGELNE